ncbi:hypothetical protein NXS19_005075 [Fusarium pseudograminearum]|nr:hypothetical protein NXS19_005075 [Fusarium pseudograminearum]
MEGYDNARCLPRIPKLFPTSDSQPELVLFSASSDTGSSTNSAPTLLILATTVIKTTDERKTKDKSSLCPATPLTRRS